MESYYSSEHTANVHFQTHVGCKDCHVVSPVEAAGEVFTFITGQYDNPLPETDMGMAECFRCHRDYDVRARATSHLHRNPHDAHWPQMECTLCHKFHQPPVDYCGQCHESGRQIQP